MEISQKNYSRFILLIIICLLAIYVGTFISACLCQYFNFGYGDWDLAIYNQAFRGLSRGELYISLAEVPYFGFHAEITPALITPLYFFFPHPITLLIIQSVMLGLAAIPLFFIARKELSEAWGLIFVISYLLYPALGYTNLNEFHPESLLPFIHFFLFYAFIKKDFRKFSIWMLACLFAKENMTLIVIAFGIYAWINKRDKKWIMLPVLCGIAWLMLYSQVIFPALSNQKVEFRTFYQHLGSTPPQMLWGIIIHPIRTLRFIIQPHKMQFILNLFGPLLFLSFLTPSVLLIALPNLLQHLLSLRLTETHLLFYYPAESLAFVFIAAIYGIKRLLQFNFLDRHKQVFYLVMPAIAIFFNILLGPQIYAPLRMQTICHKSEAVISKDRFISMIPQGASVVSTFEFLPKLSHRTDRLYSFHRVLEGVYHTEKKFSLSEDVEFALVDFDDGLTFRSFYNTGPHMSNLINFFRQNPWNAMEACENIVLFKKGGSEKYSLYQRGSPLPVSSADAPIEFGTEIRLSHYQIENPSLKKGEKLEVAFYWEAMQAMQKDYWLFICLLDREVSQLPKLAAHPLCYRIYPTYMWKEKEIIKERYSLLIPMSNIPEGKYTLVVGIFDFYSGAFLDITREGPRPKLADWCIGLADIQIN